MINCKNMLVSAVSANILPSLVWRHTRVYCIRVFKIMKTLLLCGKKQSPVKKRRNNRLAHTYQWGIRAYTVYAYLRIGIRVFAYMHTRIRVLGWRVLRVYFGSDISELHCICQLPVSCRMHHHFSQVKVANELFCIIRLKSSTFPKIEKRKTIFKTIINSISRPYDYCGFWQHFFRRRFCPS